MAWGNPLSKFEEVSIELGLSVLILNGSNKQMKLRKYVHRFHILFHLY